MRAVRIHGFGGPEVLQLDEIDRPAPKDEQVLIRVAAASVNPVDYKIRRGGYPLVKENDLPLTLGRDVAGVVEQTGPGPFSPGEEVYAHLDWSSGGYADFALCALKGLAKKPSSLSMVQAAGVPLAATTAYQGLFEHGALKAGQRVLIHGASGGVGAYAVQFAHQAGAVVFATASAEGCQAVESYGADVTIDYRHQRFEDVATDIDLVLDLVGGETQQRSFAVVKTGGALISAVTPPDAALAAERGIRIERYMAHPDADQLRLFASLIDEGRLKTTLAKTFPLEEASAAHRCLEAAHPRGKVVLRLSS